ncbi:hypothetical protein UFOVP5_42 [uncultured Caudovirales phage]|uniref:Uncharacterized protein n=1 Tax=uncultured Caudovirales phage TaxID=2100421 RepID=A0A6J5KH10_9CAUD|nr:hypothetical protein UFOVP5_42 [uncultured Caudovirales phage]
MTELWGGPAYTPTPKVVRQVGDSVAGNDALHRADMERGSVTLRDRILAFLDARKDRERRVTERNDAARKAIAAKWPKTEVMDRYGLSDTAYEQLAGQVRAGTL